MTLTPKILFEDDHLLVINKPAGLVVNRVASAKSETLEDWLEKKFNLQDLKRSGIVHRLDKETSGVMVVAKTNRVLKELERQFKQRQVAKKYLALVHGWVSPQRGEVRTPISRSAFNRKKFGVFLGGRLSRTKYLLKKNYHRNSQTFSFLELIPITGRTHQIRVHLKHLGHPVVGDAKYGGRKTSRDDRQWCPRQFLHASLLIFIHPGTGQRTEFFAPLSSDLKKVLKTLHA